MTQPDVGSTAPPERRTCGTMPVHRRLLLTEPGYAAARELSPQELEEEVAERSGHGTTTVNDSDRGRRLSGQSYRSPVLQKHGDHISTTSY